MLKVVVYDCGYGGEFFADRLEAELPILKVIRVINWRQADQIQHDSKCARAIAKTDLRPYIGKVDLIILANHLLTITSLKHFRRKYKNQLFVGLQLEPPHPIRKREAVILTTKAVTRTISYYLYLFRLRFKAQTFTLDSWPVKIDDGELTEQEIRSDLSKLFEDSHHQEEFFLACSQFYDIKTDLRKIFGHNLKIHDGFDYTLRETCKTLKIRGAMKKIK